MIFIFVSISGFKFNNIYIFIFGIIQKIYISVYLFLAINKKIYVILNIYQDFIYSQYIFISIKALLNNKTYITIII